MSLMSGHSSLYCVDFDVTFILVFLTDVYPVLDYCIVWSV